MNNIYKVIWSKAKNCYVVASEIARSHTKSASGSEKIGGGTRRKLLASLMALSLLCGGLGVASAADVTVHVDASLTPNTATEVYTTTGVNTLLDGKADKTALDTKANATDVAKNTENIATNQGNIKKLEDDKLSKDVASATYATNKALNDLENAVTNKVDESVVEAALNDKANTDLSNLTEAGKTAIKTTMADELEKKADKTYVDTAVAGAVATAGTNVDAKLADYAKTTDVYNKAEVDGKIADEENARNTAINTAITQERNDRTTAIDTAINGEVTNRNQAINTAIELEKTNRDAAISTAKAELQGKITAEETARKEADTDFNNRLTTAEGKIGDNTTAIGDLKAKDIDLEGKITQNSQDIATLDKSSVKYDNPVAKDTITLQGVGGTTITNLKDAVLSDSSTEAVTGKQLNQTNERTGGITRNTEKTQTTIEGSVNVDKQGNVKDVKGLSAETINTTGDATIGGDLKVAGTITTDKMIFGDPATNNYTEIDHGKVTSKNLVVNGAGQTISSSSTFDVEKNEVGFTNTATGDHSYYKQTAKGINGYVTDKDGNKTYTKVTATENSFQVQDKDGKNKNHQVNTKDSSVTEIKNEAGATTKTEQTATDITNTAKDGTITNDANHIVNKANTMDTNVTGKATESYGSLDTTVNGNETHIVKGTKTETVDGMVTENYKAGQATNVTGDQTTNVSGTQTTTATDINRNASSSMVDKVDNAYGTNTETKVAGKTTTDVSIKGTGEKGQYIRGANESRDYLIKGTLKNSETKTAEATSTEITDGTNKASTIQDAKNLAGSVINGTETGVSGIHANNDGSVSIDSSVAGGGMSSVINQKKDSIQSAVGDRTSSTVIHQDKDNVTIASSNGMVGLVGKDIVNNAQNTITNTAGTKITDTAGDSTVTTENGKGTTFTKTGSTAYREGGPTDTNISGNTITTGKVTMDYAKVMRDLGVNGNANIEGKTTTGSLEVKGESKLTGKVTMESDATVGGKLDVTGKATFSDDVDITNNLSVGGNATITGDVTARDVTARDVTAKSYKVGRNTYIDENGIHANNQKITDVADGSISEGSKDAVNGGQLYGVKNDLEGKVNKVGANAAAMANLHPMEFDPDSKWNIAAAIGNYGSETAAALGAFYRPNDNVMVNLSTAFGTGENMVGGGVSVRLGKGGNKLSREETNALKAQVADLTARMDALLSVLNPNMSKDFPDVPENHWAYEAVSRLAGNDIVQGYPDGEFHGERTMTRYEMAEIIYNALSRGAEAERELVEEFKPELQAMAASEKSTAEKAEG